jgi:hypothetical protein
MAGYRPEMILMSPFEDPALVLAQYRREHPDLGDFELISYGIISPRSELTTPASIAAGEAWAAAAEAKAAAAKASRAADIAMDDDAAPTLVDAEVPMLDEMPANVAHVQHSVADEDRPRRNGNGEAWPPRSANWWLTR